MSSLGWAPIQYDWCPYKEIKIQMDKKEKPCEDKENACVQAKERPQNRQPCQDLDRGLLASRSGRKWLSVV